MITRTLILGLLTLTSAITLQAQQTLEGLVTEGRAGWMIGKWEASTDSGDSVTLTFSWDLNKQVIVLHGKLPDSEFKGFTALEPGTDKISYVSFDTRGAVTRGTWGLEEGDIVLRLESRSADRDPWKMAAAFAGNETDGLQLRIHSIEDSGALSTSPRMSLKFKKSK